MALDPLHIEGSQSTPSIAADPASGVVSMAGDSYPENSFEFFNPVIEWIEAAATREQVALQLELRLIYMNTSSVKAMMDIFDLLEDAYQGGARVSVAWYYDPRNERVVEMVEEFKEDCSFPFDIVPE